jgi:hypothetical protein
VSVGGEVLELGVKSRDVFGEGEVGGVVFNGEVGKASELVGGRPVLAIGNGEDFGGESSDRFGVGIARGG